MEGDCEQRASSSWMLNNCAEILKMCKSTTELISKIDEILVICYQDQTLPKWTAAESKALTYWSQEVIKLKHLSSAIKIIALITHCIASNDVKDVTGMLKIYQAFSEFSNSNELQDDPMHIEFWDHLHLCFRCFVGNHHEIMIKYLENIGTELISSVVNPSLPLLLRSIRLKELNELLKLPSLAQRGQFRSTVKYYFKALPTMLFYVGDYDFQASIIEAIFRMTHAELRRREVTKWLPNVHCRIHSLFIRISDFDPDVRRFLNAFNRCLGHDQKVYSFVCNNASTGQLPLKKPEVASYEKFWIDFNLGTYGILIICQKDWSDSTSPGSMWESLMVKVQELEEATLVCSVHSFTLEIFLPSVEACARLFTTEPSHDFQKLLSSSIVLEFPPQKDFARVCKMLFQEKLKNFAGDSEDWIANVSGGSMPLSGDKISSSSDRRKKRMMSAAYGLEAYRNSNKEYMIDSRSFKNSSDGRESIPAKKRRRRSICESNLFACTDSSEPARERSTTSDEKAVKNHHVKSHKQKREDSTSLSKTSKNVVPLTRTLESVTAQDFKVIICDSQEELKGPLDNVAAKYIGGTDVIPSSLNSQEQQELLNLSFKTSANNFPILRKMESVTQVDLELNTLGYNMQVPSKPSNQPVSRNKIQKKSELKVDNESCMKKCPKVSKNCEVISCHNTSIINLDDYPDNYHVDSKGNKRQPFIHTSKSGKKQTLSGKKDGKCSPVTFPSVNKSFPNISPKQSFYPALEFTSPISKSKKSLRQKEPVPISGALCPSIESPVKETENINSEQKLNRNSLSGQLVTVSKDTCPTLKESIKVEEIDIVPDPKAAASAIQSSISKDIIPSVVSSMKETVLKSPNPELGEHPSKYSPSVIKSSQIKISNNLKESSLLLKVMEEREHVVPVLDLNEKHSEGLLNDRTIIPPSPSPDNDLCGSSVTVCPPHQVEDVFDNEISRPVSTSLGEEFLGYKSAIPSANQEECMDSVNTSQNPINIAVPQLQKTVTDPKIKHCNSVHADTEMNCAPATTNIDMLNATKPLSTLLNGDSSQDLLEVVPFYSKNCATMTEKGNVVNISKTCLSVFPKKLSCDLNKSSEIEIFNSIPGVELDGHGCLEVLNHLHSENKAVGIEDSPTKSYENKNSPRPSLVSTLKILAEYPMKSPVNISTKRKRNEQTPDGELPTVMQTKAGTPSSKRRKIPYLLSDHSNENTPSKASKFEGKSRNTSRKKKLFDTSSFEILQDSPPVEENILKDMHTIIKGNEPAEEEELQEIQVNGIKRNNKKQKKSIFTQKKNTDEKNILHSKKSDGKRKSSRENEIRLESVDSFENCSKSKIKKKKGKSNLEASGGFMEYPEIEEIPTRDHSVYSDYSSSGVETEHSWMYSKKTKISDVSKTYSSKKKPLDRSHPKSSSSNDEWKPFKERKRKTVPKVKHSSPVKSKQELEGKRPIRESKRRSCKEGISYCENNLVNTDAETPKKLKLYYYMSDKKATKSRDMEQENPVSPEILRHSGSSVDSGKSNYLDFQLSQKVKGSKKSLFIPTEAKIRGNEISKCFESFSEIEDISYGNVSGIGIGELSHNAIKQNLSIRSENELEIITTEVEIHASDMVIQRKDLILDSEALEKNNINISEISEIMVPAKTKSHIAYSGPRHSTLIQDEDSQIPATGRFSYIADAENSSMYQESNSDLPHCAKEVTVGVDLRLPESISSFENNVYLQFDKLEVSSEISKVNECSYKEIDMCGRKEAFSSIEKEHEPVGKANPVIHLVLSEDAEVVTENSQDNQGIRMRTNSPETHSKLPETSKEKEMATSVKYVSGQEVVSSEKVMLPVDRETVDTNPVSNHPGSTTDLDSSVNQQGGTSSIVVSTDTTNMNDVPPNTPASLASATPLGQVFQLLDKLSNNGFQDFAKAQIVSPTSRLSDQTPTLPPPRQLFCTGTGVKKDGRSTDNQPDVPHLQLLKFLTKFSSDNGTKFLNNLQWFSGSLKNAVSSLTTLSASLDEVITDVGTLINQ
ncbi:uncharacterized protein [Palaemon carinicauda]|uniref:uncharacterized protein isoform X2 n=1 Tax=Palaemon carinicauda TaxID=392227 RepID=UPI0035B61B26